MQNLSLDRLQALYDTLSQGVIFVGKDGQVISVNPAAAALLGRPFLDLAEIPSNDPEICALGDDEKLIPIDQYPAAVAIRTRAKVCNVVMGIFNPRLKQRRWFSVDACPVFETDMAEPQLVYEIFTDITEQRAADRELLQSKVHLALAQEIASVGSAALDFRTGKWDWSDETFRIYGVDRRSFVPSAEGLQGLVHPDDWPELYANVPRARAGAAPEPVVEYRIKRPDGAERIVRRIAAPVRDETGRITGVVATVQDVTDLRTAQRENEALQRELYHAQRLDSLGTLAGGIAHDLNNMLVPVVALSETILQSLGADDPKRPLLELIRQSGQRGSELVAQILAFARHEAIEQESLDVKEYLEQLLPLARAGVSDAIKIVTEFPVTARITGNKSQLHQVLLNLISNAAQAIGSGRGVIYLTTGAITGDRLGAPAEKRFIQISVADTGSGMTEEVKAHIFEPFYTTKPVGSGMGLSVALGIVTSHGGHIRVKSTPRQGSRFDVFLPVAEMSEAVLTPPGPQRPW